MLHVDFKKWQCRMSLSLFIIFSPCRMSLRPMSHVEFKKVPYVALSNLGVKGHTHTNTQYVYINAIDVK